MKQKTLIQWISSLLWAIFLIGIMEIMFYLVINEDFLSYFTVSLLMGIMVTTTAIKTYQPRIGYYHEVTPYLVHPIFLYVGFTTFLFFNSNPYLQQTALLLTTISYFILYSENFSDITHKAHDAVKFLIIFFLYNSIFETVRYFNLSKYLVPLLITIITLLFFLHMFWRLKAFKDRYLFAGLVFSIFLGLLAFLLSGYYIFTSFLILSIILLTIYYLFWGIIHHTIQKNLSFQVFFEFFLVAAIILTTILSLFFG